MRHIMLGTLALIFVPTVLAQSYPKLSPFEAVTWQDDTPHVQVQGTPYALVELNAVPVDNIVVFARHKYGSRWQKRFEEDLVQVLSEMGHVPQESVSLKLKRLSDGETVSLPAVKMTRENRKALRQARRPERRRAAPKAVLTAAEARADIDQLQKLLETRFSYLTLKPEHDYRAALNALRQSLGDNIRATELGLALRKVVAGFGDGHSRVRGWTAFVTPGFLPLSVEAGAGGRVVVLARDRSGALDPEHPYLAAIDGQPLQRWLDAAAVLVARGSPQFVHLGAIEVLHAVQFLRGELGLEQRDTIDVNLSNADGSATTTQEFVVTARRPGFQAGAQFRERQLPGNVGYISMTRMENHKAFQQRLLNAMQSMRSTAGLILDVRGNGGGSRAPLGTLLPFFMDPAGPPRVVSAARYRLDAEDKADHPDGYLRDRFMYPLAWSSWSEAERATVRAFAASFKPQWQVPESGFSDWHYFVIGPKTTAPYFYYDKPIIVLSDSACYSATDIFLGAFKGWRGVQIVGSASGGGSGRSIEHRLTHSGLQVKLSTMASYRPTGQLYDGNGVHPDIVAEPTPDDVAGVTDTVLDRALQLIADMQQGG